MEYQAPSVSIPSSKLSIGPTFSGKSTYDGVFGTPSKFEVPTFSSRVQDYRDIFSGSEASGGLSIPILEVPELNERKILEDVRSSKFDYAEIFGDFGDSDFAEPYEQIFVDPKKNESDPEESSRKPVEKLSTSEVFDTCSEGSHGLPPEAYQKPLNSIKEFNMSYHKINNGIQDGSNGTTHIAQLHAVPGYTSVFDEVTPLLVNKVDKSLTSDVSDACPSNCLREETVARNHIRETMSDFPKSGTSNGSSAKLPDTHENAHGTSQSEIPTSLSFGNNSGSSGRPMAFNFGKTSTDSFDGSNIYSPPSFDEEVDKNSVTAPSVAALRMAIEEAQARIKFAKETKGRKNIGLQHRVKLSFKGDIKDDEEKNGQIELNIFRNKKACELHELDASLYTVGMTKHHLIRPGGPDQVTLDLDPQEKILQAKEVDGETFGKDFKPIHMDHRQEEANTSETEEEFFEVCSTGQEWTTEFKEVKENGTINEAFEKPEQDANKLKPAEAELAEVEEFFEVSNTGDDWPPETSEFKEAENANNMIDEDKSKEKRNMIVISKKPEQGDREIKPDEEHSNYEGTEKKIRVCDETRAVLYCEEKNSKFTSDEVESRIQVAQGHEETENIEPVHEKDKYEEKSREFQKPMEDDERLETQRIKELELLMEPSATSNCVEKEKEEVEACELERYKKEYKDAHWVENVENNFEERSIPETIEARLHDFHSVDETEKRLGDDSASEGNETLQQDVSKENVFKGNDYQKKDNDKRQEETGQWVEDGVVETNVDDVAGYEERVKETRDLSHQNEIEATEDLYSHYESGRLNSIQEFTVKIGNQRVMDSSPEVSSCEETKCIKEGTKASLEHNQQEEEGMELVTLEENNEVEEREILESDGLPQGFKLSEILKQMEDTICPFWGKVGINLGGSEKNFEENLKDKNAMEFETVCNSGIYLEESAPELEEKFFISESAVDVHDEDAGLDVKADWLFNVSERKEKNLEREQPMKTVPSTEEYQEEEEESQSEENNEEIQQETDSSQSSEKNEDEFEIFLTSQVMETREEYHQESPTSQSAEPAEVIHQATITAEEIESNDSFQKEMELEEKPLRKTDEANERGRDKEKERMAVERAIREARERAFNEARERAEAERAATQARQRERLGKTTVQSNNKSLSEKASKKAKIKAERAAVERVLAEARERALEKAMSFKAASGARKRAERFVDEKNSGAFSDNGKKSSSPSIDPQNKGSYSSNHNERSDGANGESAPRCKARLERQQRTTERAAKALAEKNMRDLLAQREQAERNRLAEVIDAEVKRWSSGKEGNIRALLSTLQYILGPSSGWQSIPLTDIITTAAVKKAYRRATLFVHPDKLQQRGASIQQKYTCEKVFDLLKDAWSRFNMEER